MIWSKEKELAVFISCYTAQYCRSGLSLAAVEAEEYHVYNCRSDSSLNKQDLSIERTRAAARELMLPLRTFRETGSCTEGVQA